MFKGVFAYVANLMYSSLSLAHAKLRGCDSFTWLLPKIILANKEDLRFEVLQGALLLFKVEI